MQGRLWAKGSYVKKLYLMHKRLFNVTQLKYMHVFLHFLCTFNNVERKQFKSHWLFMKWSEQLSKPIYIRFVLFVDFDKKAIIDAFLHFYSTNENVVRFFQKLLIWRKKDPKVGNTKIIKLNCKYRFFSHFSFAELCFKSSKSSD
jgi:hypothetical protein